MTGNLQRARLLWAVTAVLAFVAALGGVLNRDIYLGLFPESFLPGAFPQDLLTLLVAGLLCTLAVVTRPGQVRRQVVAIGLLGSLCYLYGIFTIERVYNALYLVYAAVFATSFWAIIASLAGWRAEALAALRVPDGILRTTAWVSIAIAVIFTILWTLALIPLMRTHDRIEYLYSIYILDLCFVMPAFVITAVMALRGQPLGVVLAPAIVIVGFFVIFPLGLNELAKPAAGLPLAVGPMVVSFAFAFLMLGLGALQLRRMGG